LQIKQLLAHIILHVLKPLTSGGSEFAKLNVPNGQGVATEISPVLI
jgi:hypothetical protein